jgi:predicted exporter/lauroyl/myristoyl acyltransferase
MMRLLQRGWWLLLLLLLALGLSRISFDTEVLNLLPDDVPEVTGLKLYQRHFTDNRELIITVRGGDAAVAESAAKAIAEHLRSQTNLVAKVTWQPPWQEHPEQLAELVACLWLNQPVEQFAALTNRLAPEKLNAVLADAREQLATSLSPMALGQLGYDPFGFTDLPGQNALQGATGGQGGDGFASSDGTLRVVYVDAPEASASYVAVRKWLAQIQSEVATSLSRIEGAPSVVVRYTGAPAFVAEISTGMQRDMQGSALTSLALVAALFWWAHRSWRPLLWLGVFLGFTVLGSLAAGGLIWGRVNAVSTGFAAILLGLAVDYALVLYQESLVAPQKSAPELRRLVGPSIWWSAVTTAGAFGLLMFAGLPGLTQLAALIGVGILLAAVLMLYGFLPVVLRRRSTMAAEVAPATAATTQHVASRKPMMTVFISVALALTALMVWWAKGSRVEHAPGVMQPRNCQAQITLEELEREMNRQGHPVLLVVRGDNENAVAARLDALEVRLRAAETAGEIRSFELPAGLWPQVGRGQTNLAAAVALSAELGTMQSAVERAGFTPDAMELATTLFNWWKAHAAATNAIWPTNESSQWLLRRAVARTGDHWFAAGVAMTDDGGALPPALRQLHEQDAQIWATGWPQLAEALLQHIERRLIWLVAAILVLVAACLWFAFRRGWEILLSFATFGLSALLLLAAMALSGWSWNLMSLMAVPLLLGAGVDYTIHIQLALRRHQGDLKMVRTVTGRAVMLCAATTVAGFGSNAFSSNAGLASLGLICATGIALIYLCSVCFLPAWWICLCGGAASKESGPAQPSAFYQVRLWRVALLIARLLPRSFALWLGRSVASIYATLRPSRCAMVEQNLLPLCDGKRELARRTAHQLFANFGGKLVQLWRREAGLIAEPDLTRWSGWDSLAAAQATGRGVLLVTPHLGDWELGGTMLARRGVRLLVLTQPEPGAGFTELRQRSRARSGIETLVVGQDAFAFIEVIKHLQSGAVVALLVDRPAAPTAVTVELFGRTFQASVAAAELARAAGCVVLPVYVVQDGPGAEAHVLPEITYDRQQLGSREARREMTQRIMSTFEPVIQKHADQWYHFVPVWLETKT